MGTYIPPFVIFPGQRMREELLQGGLPGTDGDVSVSGWSNTVWKSTNNVYINFIHF
jgi:hypothetical protein